MNKVKKVGDILVGFTLNDDSTIKLRWTTVKGLTVTLTDDEEKDVIEKLNSIVRTEK